MNDMFSIEFDDESEADEVSTEDSSADEVEEDFEDIIDLSELIESMSSSIAAELSVPEVFVQENVPPVSDLALTLSEDIPVLEVEEKVSEETMGEEAELGDKSEEDEEDHSLIESFMEEAFALEVTPIEGVLEIKDEELPDLPIEKVFEIEEEEITDSEIEKLIRASERAADKGERKRGYAPLFDQLAEKYDLSF